MYAPLGQDGGTVHLQPQRNRLNPQPPCSAPVLQQYSGNYVSAMPAVRRYSYSAEHAEALCADMRNGQGPPNHQDHGGMLEATPADASLQKLQQMEQQMKRYGRKFERLQTRLRQEGFPDVVSEFCDEDLGERTFSPSCSPPFRPDTGSTPASECRESSVPPSISEAGRHSMGESPESLPPFTGAVDDKRGQQILAIRDPETGLIYSARHVYAPIGQRSPPPKPRSLRHQLGSDIMSPHGSPSRQRPGSESAEAYVGTGAQRRQQRQQQPDRHHNHHPLQPQQHPVSHQAWSYVPAARPVEQVPVRSYSYVPQPSAQPQEGEVQRLAVHSYAQLAPHSYAPLAPQPAIPTAPGPVVSPASPTPMNDPHFLRRSLCPGGTEPSAMSSPSPLPSLSGLAPGPSSQSFSTMNSVAAPAPIPLQPRTFAVDSFLGPRLDGFHQGPRLGSFDLAQTDSVPMRSRCVSPMPGTSTIDRIPPMSNGPMISDGFHPVAPDLVPMRSRCTSPMMRSHSPMANGTISPMQSHYASPANSRGASPMGSRVMHPALSTSALQPLQVGHSSGLQHTSVTGWSALQSHIRDVSGPGNYSVLPDDQRQQLPAPPWPYGETVPSQTEHVGTGRFATDDQKRLPAPPVHGSLPSSAASQWASESRHRGTATGGGVRHHVAMDRHSGAVTLPPAHQDSLSKGSPQEGMVPTSSNLQDTMPGPLFDLAPEPTSLGRLPPRKLGKAYPESFPALSMHN